VSPQVDWLSQRLHRETAINAQYLTRDIFCFFAGKKGDGCGYVRDISKGSQGNVVEHLLANRFLQLFCHVRAVKPGATALTVTWRPATSLAKALAEPIGGRF
jgi:hypothetical protein